MDYGKSDIAAVQHLHLPTNSFLNPHMLATDVINAVHDHPHPIHNLFWIYSMSEKLALLQDGHIME